MKRRPNLVLRDPVKLYETRKDHQKVLPKTSKESELNQPKKKKELEEPELGLIELKRNKVEKKNQDKRFELSRDKMSPRIQQIWDYLSKKVKSGEEITRSFCLTRAEVMKEAGIGSTNTYRDALKKFKELNLLEIELRPGVNSGSLFTLTEKGIDELEG